MSDNDGRLNGKVKPVVLALLVASLAWFGGSAGVYVKEGHDDVIKLKAEALAQQLINMKFEQWKLEASKLETEHSVLLTQIHDDLIKIENKINEIQREQRGRR